MVREPNWIIWRSGNLIQFVIKIFEDDIEGFTVRGCNKDTWFVLWIVILIGFRMVIYFGSRLF